MWWKLPYHAIWCWKFYDTNAASSVLFKNILYLLWNKIINIKFFFLDTLWLSLKINPTLWRFGDNPLKIDWDIDENVQFCSKHRVVTPCCDCLKKINPTLWRFGDNLLRIDWDIDENVQCCSKHRVVTPCCNCLEKLTLLCESLETIR